MTVFGESAGAGSVSLLMLSPAAKGLFKRAIAQSGVATNIWAMMNSKSTSTAASFGSSLGCKNIKTLTRCLRGKSWKEIMKEQYKIKTQFYPPKLPTVDGRVIKIFPYSQLKQGKLPLSSVDLLLGFNKDEGTTFVPHVPKWNKRAYEAFSKRMLSFRYGKSSKLVSELTSFEYAHLNEKTEAEKYRKATADFMSDYGYKVDIINFARAWSKGRAKTFLYCFSHLPKHLKNPLLGVNHELDVSFIMGKPLYPFWDSMRQNSYITKFTNDDATVSLNMMKMWANFAKTGNPGYNWPVFTTSKKEYLNIKLKPSVGSNYNPRMMAFWNYYIPREIQRAAKTCLMKPSKQPGINRSRRSHVTRRRSRRCSHYCRRRISITRRRWRNDQHRRRHHIYDRRRHLH